MDKSLVKISLEELLVRRNALQDRIRRLENDVRAPVDVDFDEQAQGLGGRMVTRALLDVERETLCSLEQEIHRRKG